jgi:shikimate dehydrogenase
MPHKESIMPLLDRIDPAAKSIGAVNTVVNRKGVLSGYNTDLDGIAYALKGLSLARKKVLIVGAGGAARAVAHVVRKQGGEIIYLNRTAAKARKLMKEFGGRIAKEKELVAGDIDLIVNATPVGMHPKTAGMPLSERLIAKHQAVFDLVYNPLETRLLKTAKRKGAKAISGLDMFVVQGLRQVELMSGRKIITPESVRSAARSLKKKI